MDDLFAEPRRLLEGAGMTGLMRVTGRVAEARGLMVVARGLPLPVGAMCWIHRRQGGAMAAQVVGLQGESTMLMPLDTPLGIRVGDRVVSGSGVQSIGVGPALLGRVTDGMGRPIDDGGAIHTEQHYPVYTSAPRALARRPIDQALATGVRSIDGFLTIGAGQRMGIFAGTGVGKSVLMGMIARFTSADVNVVALVGERGREVGDFLRKDLGEEGLKRTVMVVSTSDESPVMRVRACFTAMAIAEYFRDAGRHVLLLMDSVTRMAMAQRQIGLAAGEPPTTKGYPPSVFALMPALLERSGSTEHGSITGLFTVLVEGDDINEPIADAARGILDGHIWLSRDLANRSHFPAVSVLEGVSRVMTDVVGEGHRKAAAALRGLLATWADIEDMVNINAYAPGSNPTFDVAIRMKPKLDAFLRQGMHESSSLSKTREGLVGLADEADRLRQQLEGGLVVSAGEAQREGGGDALAAVS